MEVKSNLLCIFSCSVQASLAVMSKLLTVPEDLPTLVLFVVEALLPKLLVQLLKRHLPV